MNWYETFSGRRSSSCRRQHEESNLSPDTPIKVDDNFEIPLNSSRWISDKEVDLADRIAVDARVGLDVEAASCVQSQTRRNPYERRKSIEVYIGLCWWEGVIFGIATLWL